MISGGKLTDGKFMNRKVADQSVGDRYQFVRATGLASLLLVASLFLTSKPAAAKPAKKKPAPAARVDALIVGGVDQYNGPMASAEAFNANAGTFSCVGGLNSSTGLCNNTLVQPRFFAAVAALPGGEVLIAGGNGNAGQDGTACLNSAETFNPVARSFTTVGSMTDAHCLATTAILGNGEVLVTGGEDETGNLINTADMYNPASGKFDCSRLGGADQTTGYCLSTMTDSRFLDTATTLADGRVLIAGGNDGSIVKTAEIFDPASGTFGCSSLGGADPKTGFCNNTMTDSRQNHTATLLVTGRNGGDVLIAGGLDAAGAVLQTAELFSPSSGTFVCVNGAAPGPSGCPLQMTHARYLHTATFLDPKYVKGRLRGDILITGGEDAQGNALATAEVYDPVAKTFKPVGTMTTSRALHSATLIASGSHKGWVLIAGGIDDAGNSLKSTELFNPQTGTFVAVGAMNLARSSASSAGQVP